MGSDSEQSEVKPTISEKKMVTASNCSANTGCPSFNLLATELKKKSYININGICIV